MWGVVTPAGTVSGTFPFRGERHRDARQVPSDAVRHGSRRSVAVRVQRARTGPARRGNADDTRGNCPVRKAAPRGPSYGSRVPGPPMAGHQVPIRPTPSAGHLPSTPPGTGAGDPMRRAVAHE